MMNDVIQDEVPENPKSEIRNPKSVRYDQKLEFILRTSARIFAEKNYHSTSMRDISRATGISLAGLYHYCKSKEELLFLIQDNCFARVIERLEERLPEAPDPVSELRLFIENHLSFFAANMSEMKVLSHEAASLRGDLHAHVSTRKDRYSKIARKILSNVQSSRTDGPQIDLTVATYALFGMMNWIYNWYDPNGKLKSKDLAQNLTQLFLAGFLASDVSEDENVKSLAKQSDNPSIWRGTTF
jgi:TetR/AcrR family transcriptional regulator, cholesterol catabolism regulator